MSGTITEIKGDTLSIKTAQGERATVNATRETQFQRDRKDAQLSDFKVGETVEIRGERDRSGVWNARSIATRSESGKADAAGDALGGPPNLPDMGKPPFVGGPPKPQDLGKTFIAGQVKTIENGKLTIHRPDGVDQSIEINDKTKILDSRGEAIKLEDIKAGDEVIGTGSLKGDVFVAAELRKPPSPPQPPPLPFSRPPF